MACAAGGWIQVARDSEAGGDSVVMGCMKGLGIGYVK